MLRQNKIYIGLNNKYYKIGQTSQDIKQRQSEIRKKTKGFEMKIYIEFTHSKAFTEMVESILRYEIESNGYEIIGNDHITKKGEFDDIVKIYLASVTSTLNRYKIDYKVVHIAD